ncbi:MAG: metallophosphoesterase [Phycisphaerae bacterium]
MSTGKAASQFRLLVLTDIHYSRAPSRILARRTQLGLELPRRAIEDASRRGGFDAVAILGDVLDDGASPDGDLLLQELADCIRAAAARTPLVVVPGNHDGDFDRFFSAFGDAPGLHRIGQYRFITFADSYAAGDVCTRDQAGRDLLRQVAAEEGGPIIVLQHNPMNPAIDDPYPYMLTNRDQVMRDYADAGVLLSISGHYHRGQELSESQGVKYLTAPALCESPFRYLLVRLNGRQVRVDGGRLESGPDDTEQS